MFDPRLQANILNLVDVSYGGENGPIRQFSYQQKFIKCQIYPGEEADRKIFCGGSQDTGKYVFNVNDTLKSL